MRTGPPRTPTLLLALALGAVAAAILLRLDALRAAVSRLTGSTTASVTITPAARSFATTTTAAAAAAASASTTMSSSESGTKGQVYFLSHGGPPTMFDTQSAPYKAWIKYGQAVTASKPRGLVVVSAHWENDANSPDVLVNEDTTNPLVYDFYGFPREYYQQTFTSHGDAAMLADIKQALAAGGVRASATKRGLDHGVWVPFKVAFKGAATDIPIIQVSLPGDSSPISAAKLGRALAPLREKGYGIMGTGQAVHNLRDYMTGRNASYGKAFLSAVSDAVADKEPAAASINLFRHPQYRNAHPTPEHLLPLVVAAAAVEPGDDALRTLFVEPNGALGWGMWMWGQKEGAAAVETGAAAAHGATPVAAAA